MRAPSDLAGQQPGADVPVAVIGVAARAAGAPDLDALWRRIVAGRDVITDIPPDRIPGFDAERLGVQPPRGALLDRIDTFDAGFFGLSPRQSAYMDPRQRLLLEETWHALEDACVDPATLANSVTGIFVGATGADFRLRCDGLGAIDQYTAAGTMDAFLANRISYQLDLRGASVDVDTACSSGLTAVVQAVWALAAGQLDLAIAAGVSVICHGFDQEAYLRAGILSPTGRVRPFSAEADGYVRGEGVAVVALKRLADAERDGDPIRAVIRAASQSHDGRAGGQFGPSAQTQAALVRRAAQRADVTPDALGYVECHATGTKLGDEAEALGLAGALDGAERAAGPDGRLWVGALKAVIGHTEGAAGLFGLVKAVLVVEHGLIPPIPGLVELAAPIAANASVLGFPTAPVPWPHQPGRDRLAGVSSFGLGGANAHVVISDPPQTAPASARRDLGARYFPLSAATPAARAALASSFASWLVTRSDADLPAVAWTLQTGRSPLACRAVLCGESVAQLAEAARKLAAEPDAQGSGETVDPAAVSVVTAFRTGQDADWRALWDGRSGPRRTRLPGYQFERHSHWPRAERAPQALSAPPLPPPAALPPVLSQQPEPNRQAHSSPLAPSPAPARPGGLVHLPPLDGFPARPTTSQPAAVPPATPQPAAVPPATPRPAAVPPPAAAVPSAVDAAELARLICAVAAEVLYLSPGAIALDQDLVNAGLDSVLAVEFARLIHGRTGLELRVERIYATRTSHALAADLLTPDPGPATDTVPARETGAAQHPSPPGDPGQAVLTGRLKDLAGECLYLAADDIDPDAELTAIGLDSVLAVEFLAKLNSTWGTNLTLSDMYARQTLGGLAGLLALEGQEAAR